jgi:hypothetical protein
MTAEQARSMLGITLAIMAGLMAIGLAIYVFIVVVLATGGSAFEEGPHTSPPGGLRSE